MSNKTFKEILCEWNNTETNYPANKVIQELFEEQVKKRPNQVAIQFKKQSLTYKELNRTANQLAYILRRKYIEHFNKPFSKDVLVGVCSNNKLEVLIAFLGILKAGGAYIPLDPTYPKERTQFILQDAKIEIFLTSHNTLELNNILAKLINNHITIYLDRLSTMKTTASEKNPTLINNSNDLAYVIYTSGSTGIPKGVLIEHKSVNRLVKKYKLY